MGVYVLILIYPGQVFYSECPLGQQGAAWGEVSAREERKEERRESGQGRARGAVGEEGKVGCWHRAAWGAFFSSETVSKISD